jgi:hypothetical protein
MTETAVFVELSSEELCNLWRAKGIPEAYLNTVIEENLSGHDLRECTVEELVEDFKMTKLKAKSIYGWIQGWKADGVPTALLLGAALGTRVARTFSSDITTSPPPATPMSPVTVAPLSLQLPVSPPQQVESKYSYHGTPIDVSAGEVNVMWKHVLKGRFKNLGSLHQDCIVKIGADAANEAEIGRQLYVGHMCVPLLV